MEKGRLSTPMVPSTSKTKKTSASSPPPHLPEIDLNRTPFVLQSPLHNLMLTLVSQSTNLPHPWIKCNKCGKWRKLPPTLSSLSPMLPSTPLTLSTLSSLTTSFIPFPFRCSSNTWDLDRNLCSAIQDYQDLVYEWKSPPLKFVRAVPRMDFYIVLAHYMRLKETDIKEYPYIYGKPVDLFALYNAVSQLGGDEQVTKLDQWPAVYHLLKLPATEEQPPDFDYLTGIYRTYFFEWQNDHNINFKLIQNLMQQQQQSAAAQINKSPSKQQNTTTSSNSNTTGKTKSSTTAVPEPSAKRQRITDQNRDAAGTAQNKDTE